MGQAKYRLEGTDGTLHGNPLEIEPAPEVGIAEDTRIKALVGVWIDVDAPPIEGGGAGLVTAAAPGHAIGGLDALGLWTDKFETHRAVLAPANAVKGHGDVVSGAKRDTVLIQISGAGHGSAARVDGDHSSLEPVFPQQRAIQLIGVKGGVTQEGGVTQRGMGVMEIPQDRQKGLRVSKLLVRVRIIGTLFYGDLRVVFLEILVEQGDMAHDAQPIGKDARLLRIAEMAVDILLFYGGVGGGMTGQQRVDAFIWVKTRCELCQRFCLTQLRGHKLWIIFRHIAFNAGGVKNQAVGQLRVHGPADRFRQLHQTLKHLSDIRPKSCLNRVSFAPSGTFSNPQNSRISRLYRSVASSTLSSTYPNIF